MHLLFSLVSDVCEPSTPEQCTLQGEEHELSYSTGSEHSAVHEIRDQTALRLVVLQLLS